MQNEIKVKVTSYLKYILDTALALFNVKVGDVEEYGLRIGCGDEPDAQSVVWIQLRVERRKETTRFSCDDVTTRLYNN